MDCCTDRRHPLSILLVEDTLANQRVIRSILTGRGHELAVAPTGQEALEQFRRQRFDVILMDVHMPVMDGYQTTAAIRALEQATGTHTPIIALTAHSTPGDSETCLRAGMDAYLSKPIDVGALVVAVERTAAPPAVDPPGGREADSKTDAELPPIDLTATMQRLGGDPELLRDFIEVFEEDSPRLLETLEAAVAARQVDIVQRVAHSLRGLAANFGATLVIEAATRLEVAGKEANLEDAESELARLVGEVMRLSTALQPYRGPTPESRDPVDRTLS